ncbi:carbonic anhydrase 2 [Verrucomicrobiota bacterium]|nr:carbonic anhydrase 2 [Verrucomicrobiota bacterium]
MPKISELFTQNLNWSEDIRRKRPEFFETLSKQQSPKFLWIGCADSRVPANEVVGLLPESSSCTVTSLTSSSTPT